MHHHGHSISTRRASLLVALLLLLLASTSLAFAAGAVGATGGDPRSGLDFSARTVR